MEMLQNQKEFYQLLNLYKELQPKKVLEIGVKFGGSLRQWIDNAEKDTKIVAVDDCKQVDFSETNKSYAKLKEIDLHFIKGNSHSWSVEKQVNQLGPYDFVFIDGDHTYEGVNMDWEMYGNAPIVAFHDIVPHAKQEDNGPSELWKQLKVICPKTLEFVDDWQQGWGGIGVVLTH